MKKLFPAILAVMVVAVLFSCRGGNEQRDTAAPGQPSPAAATLAVIGPPPVNGRHRAAASSELPPSRVGNYVAGNITDMNQETAWAEGIPGLGIGEWVASYLGEASVLGDISVCRVEIRSGYQKGGSLTDNCVPTALRLTTGLVCSS